MTQLTGSALRLIVFGGDVLVTEDLIHVDEVKVVRHVVRPADGQ